MPGYGQVHVGFYEIYQGLQPDIYAQISWLSSLITVTRFFFTGHSLGCGLSSLAVPNVVTNTFIKPIHAPVLHHNLASPRVGDPQFAYMMNKIGVPTYRIVNTEDVVPDGPPPVFSSYLYKHIGIPVDFTAQYGTTLGNHGLDTAYDYAIAHPNDPEGPLPARALGLAKLPGVNVAFDGKLKRLPRRPTQGSATPT